MITGQRITFLPQSIILTDIIDKDYSSFNSKSVLSKFYENNNEYFFNTVNNANNSKKEKDLSTQSIRKLNYAIKTLYHISETKTLLPPLVNKPYKYKLSFITLTLPASQDNITDNQIKRECLNKFFIYAKRKFNLKSYVWKAEAQKNGNIHFHITTDIFIQHQELRDTWNNCISSMQFLNKFYEKFNHYTPNSTDIHAVRKETQVDIYLAKYLSKEKGKAREISGKKWNCSNNLSYDKRFRFIANGNDIQYFFKLSKIKNVKFYNEDFYSMIVFKENNIYNKLPSEWKNKYNEHLNFLRNL